jgi:type VI secretion system protein ImpE
MNAQELYREGRLQDAIATATEEVKNNPTDASRRGFLCQLLAFAGDLERVDLHLDVLGHQDPGATMAVGMLRHLVRAEQARRQFFSDGRLPEFLGEPSPVLRLHLEASIRLREGMAAEAVALLEKAEEQRPKLTGKCDGQPFNDLRDLDDLTAPLFEVLTSNGKYYWIPMERVELVEFRPYERPYDLLWRGAHMIVRDGPDGEVFIPALYAGSNAEADDRFRLGRMTDWRGGDGTPVRGIGQRTFLIGEKDRPILEMSNLTFG